jgi:hypothetical protein
VVAALVVLRGEASEADLPTVAAVRDGSTPANWNPRQRGGVVAWREACAVGRGSRRARRTAAHLAALCLKLKAFRLAGRPHRAMAPWSFLTISRRDAALPWDDPTPGSTPLQGDSPRGGVPYRGSAPQRRSWTSLLHGLSVEGNAGTLRQGARRASPEAAHG